MTVERERIVELLYAAVDDLNRQLRRNQRLAKSPDAPVADAGSGLDSLAVVNLLVLAEQRIEGAFGASVMLADEEALAREPSPFRTLGSLAEHMQSVTEREMERTR